MIRSGLLVMITSRRVAEVGVTRVGVFIICVSLLLAIIRDSLLLGRRRLSLRSPNKKNVFLRIINALNVSSM